MKNIIMAVITAIIISCSLEVSANPKAKTLTKSECCSKNSDCICVPDSKGGCICVPASLAKVAKVSSKKQVCPNRADCICH